MIIGCDSRRVSCIVHGARTLLQSVRARVAFAPISKWILCTAIFRKYPSEYVRKHTCGHRSYYTHIAHIVNIVYAPTCNNMKGWIIYFFFLHFLSLVFVAHLRTPFAHTKRPHDARYIYGDIEDGRIYLKLDVIYLLYLAALVVLCVLRGGHVGLHAMNGDRRAVELSFWGIHTMCWRSLASVSDIVATFRDSEHSLPLSSSAFSFTMYE